MNCTQQTDSFITGERGGGEAECRETERTKRNVPKTGGERVRERGQRRRVGGIGSRWKEDERKESVGVR